MSMNANQPVAEWVNYEQGFQRLTDEPLPEGTQLYAHSESKSPEILELSRKLAAETLRADQGWSRADGKTKECLQLRERMAVSSEGPQTLAIDNDSYDPKPVLEQLAKVLIGHPHRFINTANPRSTTEEWPERERPYEWHREEITFNKGHQFEAWIDSGRGHLALIVDGKLRDYGKSSLIHPDVAFLDKEYYSSDKHLFF